MAKIGQSKAVETMANLRELAKPKKSKDVVLKNFRLMLLGPAGEGKTTCAATASEFCSESFPAKKMTELEDMFWILADPGGLEGFASLNISVNHVDLHSVEEENLPQFLDIVMNNVEEQVKAGKIKTIVVDSLSMLDKLLLNKYKRDFENYAIYDALGSKHMLFNARLRSLDCNVIWLCHGKEVHEVTKKEIETGAAKTKQGKCAADGLTPGDVRVDLVGQTERFYRSAMSNIYPVARTGKGDKAEYNLYPYGIRGWEWKNKYPQLDRKEPANLQKLFKKIRGDRK